MSSKPENKIEKNRNMIKQYGSVDVHENDTGALRDVFKYSPTNKKN